MLLSLFFYSFSFMLTIHLLLGCCLCSSLTAEGWSPDIPLPLPTHGPGCSSQSWFLQARRCNSSCGKPFRTMGYSLGQKRDSADLADHLFQAQEQLPISKKSCKKVRRPAWMNHELLTKLKHMKEAYKRQKQVRSPRRNLKILSECAGNCNCCQLNSVRSPLLPGPNSVSWLK